MGAGRVVSRCAAFVETVRSAVSWVRAVAVRAVAVKAVRSAAVTADDFRAVAVRAVAVKAVRSAAVRADAVRVLKPAVFWLWANAVKAIKSTVFGAGAV